MPVFKYKAVQMDGTPAEGQLEAHGRLDALRQLAAMGLRPIRLVERVGKTGTTAAPTSPTGIRFRYGWFAAALFGVSLFLPAVNLDPWLPGFNLFVLSFYGTAFFGAAALRDGSSSGDFSVVLGNFVTCLVGALANVLMLTALFRSIRGRPVPASVAALGWTMTLVAAAALCHRSGRGMGDTLSAGYFAWAGTAALLMAEAMAQRARLGGNAR